MSPTIKRIIPNIFTFTNMVCGFLSIVYATEGEFIIAAWLIFFAALCDALDGVAARLTNSVSKFGVEIDSLADVISFGLAPAFLAYSIHLNSLPIIGLGISSLFLIAGGYRLARFNSNLVGNDKDFFYGLPIPSAALTLIAFIILFYNADRFDSTGQIILPYTVVALAILMVSKIKYETLPKPSLKSLKAEPIKFLLAFVALIIVVVTSGKGLFFVFIFYILYGILKQLIEFVSGNSKTKPS